MRTKYHKDNGHFNEQHVLALAGGSENIAASIREILVANANQSLSYNTWRQHSTVLKLIAECQKETRVDLSLPWTEAAQATFIGWNIKRKVRDSTLKVYLSKVNFVYSILRN